LPICGFEPLAPPLTRRVPDDWIGGARARCEKVIRAADLKFVHQFRNLF